ncbi:MICOS complex subunit MIC19 [Diorhabda sublineata]|uniref:MICOS complex subunit MIC19 n=1 Tax=Diorhabda sublineata TaxID=1163346 RepID=UPI0024E0FB04|nr:MICOS complex subunit MIC19 [Diorhabda sublineata]
MGASSSATRKLTIENDDPTSVIKVSEEVVDRLTGSQVKSENVKQPPPMPPPHGGAGPFPMFWHEPSLNTYQVRQASTAELKKNDEYWQQRLKNLEDKHKKMNEVLDKEYEKALQEVSSKNFAGNVQNLPPCKDREHAVMECYKCNPNESMKCAKVVQAFQECVDLRRNCLLASKYN